MKWYPILRNNICKYSVTVLPPTLYLKYEDEIEYPSYKHALCVILSPLSITLPVVLLVENKDKNGCVPKHNDGTLNVSNRTLDMLIRFDWGFRRGSVIKMGCVLILSSEMFNDENICVNIDWMSSSFWKVPFLSG